MGWAVLWLFWKSWELDWRDWSLSQGTWRDVGYMIVSRYSIKPWNPWKNWCWKRLWSCWTLVGGLNHIFLCFWDDQEVDFDSQEQWTRSINQPHLRISALQHSGGLAQLLPHLGRALVVILSFKTIQCWWLMVDGWWCFMMFENCWCLTGLFIHSHPFPSGFGAPRPRTLGQTLASVAGAERAARLETGGKAAPSTGQCPAETPGSKRPWRNQQGYGEHIWRTPQMGVTPIAGWFIMENPI